MMIIAKNQATAVKYFTPFIFKWTFQQITSKILWKREYTNFLLNLRGSSFFVFFFLSIPGTMTIMSLSSGQDEKCYSAVSGLSVKIRQNISKIGYIYTNMFISNRIPFHFMMCSANEKLLHEVLK